MRCESSDHRDIDDSTEPIDANDPADRIEHAEPSEPTERNDPTEPIESTEPFEPIDRNEFSDHNDQRELDDDAMPSVSRARRLLRPDSVCPGQVRSSRTAMAALRPFRAMTLPAGWVAAPQR